MRSPEIKLAPLMGEITPELMLKWLKGQEKEYSAWVKSKGSRKLAYFTATVVWINQRWQNSAPPQLALYRPKQFLAFITHLAQLYHQTMRSAPSVHELNVEFLAGLNTFIRSWIPESGAGPDDKSGENKDLPFYPLISGIMRTTNGCSGFNTRLLVDLLRILYDRQLLSAVDLGNALEILTQLSSQKFLYGQIEALTWPAYKIPVDALTAPIASQILGSFSSLAAGGYFRGIFKIRPINTLLGSLKDKRVYFLALEPALKVVQSLEDLINQGVLTDIVNLDVEALGCLLVKLKKSGATGGQLEKLTHHLAELIYLINISTNIPRKLTIKSLNALLKLTQQALLEEKNCAPGIAVLLNIGKILQSGGYKKGEMKSAAMPLFETFLDPESIKWRKAKEIADAFYANVLLAVSLPEEKVEKMLDVFQSQKDQVSPAHWGIYTHKIAQYLYYNHYEIPAWITAAIIQRKPVPHALQRKTFLALKARLPQGYSIEMEAFVAIWPVDILVTEVKTGLRAVVEIDGGTHEWHGDLRIKDRDRDDALIAREKVVVVKRVHTFSLSHQFAAVINDIFTDVMRNFQPAARKSDEKKPPEIKDKRESTVVMPEPVPVETWQPLDIEPVEVKELPSRKSQPSPTDKRLFSLKNLSHQLEQTADCKEIANVVKKINPASLSGAEGAQLLTQGLLYDQKTGKKGKSPNSSIVDLLLVLTGKDSIWEQPAGMAFPAIERAIIDNNTAAIKAFIAKITPVQKKSKKGRKVSPAKKLALPQRWESAVAKARNLKRTDIIAIFENSFESITAAPKTSEGKSASLSGMEKDMPQIEIRALNGHGPSQFNLALDFFKRSEANAAKEKRLAEIEEEWGMYWLKASAAQNFIPALRELGRIYFAGLHVVKDTKESSRYYRLGAEQGDAHCQYCLGENYQLFDQNINEALISYHLAAAQGFTAAQGKLGNCYWSGTGVEKNLQKAIDYYRLAARQGDLQAQFALGSCYDETSEWVGKDMQEAIKYYRQAAEQGHLLAQFTLGDCYFKGTGVAQDIKETLRWWSQAADNGYSVAQFRLGECYENGTQGAPKNLSEAVKYYRLAAVQNYADAQFSLGACYYEGIGVQKSHRKSVKLWLLAAAQGNVNALSHLGLSYTNGYGVDKNLEKASNYYRMAMEAKGLAVISSELPSRSSASRPDINKPLTMEESALALAKIQELLPVFLGDFTIVQENCEAWLDLADNSEIAAYMTKLAKQIDMALRVLHGIKTSDSKSLVAIFNLEKLTLWRAKELFTLWQCARRPDVEAYFKSKALALPGNPVVKTPGVSYWRCAENGALIFYSPGQCEQIRQSETDHKELKLKINDTPLLLFRGIERNLNSGISRSYYRHILQPETGPDFWAPLRAEKSWSLHSVDCGIGFLNTLLMAVNQALPDYEVVNFEVNRNLDLWALYNAFRIILTHLESSFEERVLWYRADAKSALDICANGFNRDADQYLKFLGKGVYLGISPEQVAYRAAERNILIPAWVALGDVIAGSVDMQVLPVKAVNGMAYRNAAARKQDPDIYTITHDHQAFPIGIFTLQYRNTAGLLVSPAKSHSPDIKSQIPLPTSESLPSTSQLSAEEKSFDEVSLRELAKKIQEKKSFQLSLVREYHKRILKDFSEQEQIIKNRQEKFTLEAKVKEYYEKLLRQINYATVEITADQKHTLPLMAAGKILTIWKCVLQADINLYFKKLSDSKDSKGVKIIKPDHKTGNAGDTILTAEMDFYYQELLKDVTGAVGGSSLLADGDSQNWRRVQEKFNIPRDCCALIGLTLSASHQGYIHSAVVAFSTACAGYKIKGVIVNYNPYDFYLHNALRKVYRSRSTEAQEIILWQGSPSQKEADVLSTRGFNRSSAKEKPLGNGVHFMVNPREALLRARPNEAGVRTIIAAEVLIEDVCLAPTGNPTLQRKKDSHFFHTTYVNDLKSPTMYAATEDNQAFPILFLVVQT